LAQTGCRVKIAYPLPPASRAPGHAALAGAICANEAPLGGTLTIRQSFPARVVNTLLRFSPRPEASAWAHDKFPRHQFTGCACHMRHVPCAGALWRLPFAGSGHVVAVAKNGMPGPYYIVIVP